MIPLAMARYRAGIIDAIRQFCRDGGMLEVETPVLSRGVSTDVFIDVFSTRFHTNGYSEQKGSHSLYLQTSPELHMKRLLAHGYPDIFEICRVFRNGEHGRVHNPEFTMLEWYRLNCRMSRLIDEAVAVCSLVLKDALVKKSTYRNCFIEYTGIDPLETGEAELREFCRQQSVIAPPIESKTAWLQYIMSHFIEPSLPPATLYCIYDFPIGQASLALVNGADDRTALRFEIYYEGIELCNGFEELADPGENRRRLENENEYRRNHSKPLLPLDERFLTAMASFPSGCSGAALGIDSLVMLGAGAKRIDEVLLFPFNDC